MNCYIEKLRRDKRKRLLESVAIGVFIGYVVIGFIIYICGGTI